MQRKLKKLGIAAIVMVTAGSFGTTLYAIENRPLGIVLSLSLAIVSIILLIFIAKSKYSHLYQAPKVSR